MALALVLGGDELMRFPMAHLTLSLLVDADGRSAVQLKIAKKRGIAGAQQPAGTPAHDDELGHAI